MLYPHPALVLFLYALQPAVFQSASSPSYAPAAPWDADGRGRPRCIFWFRISLTLTTRGSGYHTDRAVVALESSDL